MHATMSQRLIPVQIAWTICLCDELRVTINASWCKCLREVAETN